MEKCNIVLSKYLLIEEIGKGGMASISLGVQLSLSRLVAVKQIHRRLIDNKEIIELFEREAKILASVEHENIVGAIDYGSDDENYYIIMNFVRGLSLHELFCIDKQIPKEIIVYILRRLLDSLDFAHSKSILHRDIKLSNVIISTEGTVKLVDFGVAALSADIEGGKERQFVGTPRYMAPELYKGMSATPASDIYSLGIVFAELLSGKAINYGLNTNELYDKVKRGIGPIDDSLSAVIDDGLLPLIRKMTDSNPINRPTCSQIIDYLDDYIRQVPGKYTKKQMKDFLLSRKNIWLPRKPEVEIDVKSERIQLLIADAKKQLEKEMRIRLIKRIATSVAVAAVVPLYFLLAPFLPLGIRPAISGNGHEITVRNSLGTMLFNEAFDAQIAPNVLVGNVTSKFGKEVIFGTMDSDSLGNPIEKGGKLFVYSRRGRLLYTLDNRPEDPFDENQNERIARPITLFDFDDNGIKQIVWSQGFLGGYSEALLVNTLYGRSPNKPRRWWFHGEIFDAIPGKDDSEIELFVIAKNTSLGPVYSISRFVMSELKDNRATITMPVIRSLDNDDTPSLSYEEDWLHLFPHSEIGPPSILSIDDEFAHLSFNNQGFKIDKAGNLLDTVRNDILVSSEDLREFWLSYHKLCNLYLQISEVESESVDGIEDLINHTIEAAPNRFYRVQAYFLGGRISDDILRSIERYRIGIINSEDPFLGVMPDFTYFIFEYVETLGESHIAEHISEYYERLGIE